MDFVNFKLPTGTAVFAALAAMAKRERKRPRRADRRARLMEQQARSVAAARRRRARLQREAQGRVAARLKSERAARGRAPLPYGSLVGGIMRVMEPGHWYGARDIALMAGRTGDSTRATLIQKLMVQGLVERVQNPDWRPYGCGPTSVGTPQENATREVEPMWLYRLTPLGEAKQAAAAAAAVQPG